MIMDKCIKSEEEFEERKKKLEEKIKKLKEMEESK